MTSTTKTGPNGFAQLMLACCLAGTAALSAGPAGAQSAYDCRGLESHAALPAIEGIDGTFFAIQPELQSHHGLGDATIAMLSDLNLALAARGTTLVLLPVPTRAQTLTHQLPTAAADLGYDVALSTSVHVGMVARLTAAGITVADPLPDLRIAAANGAKPFFEADPRPTAAGMQLLAKTVASALSAHPNLTGLTRGMFRSTAGAQVTLASTMRLQLQLACQSELPAVTTQAFTTIKAANGPVNNGNLVLLGADATATSELNLTGFISEQTGLFSLGYGVVGGGAFAAISSYLTSADFQAAPPRVIVWELPTSASLASHGDQPLRELVVAAGNKCEMAVPVTRLAETNRLRADLGQMLLQSNATLLLDGGSSDMPFVRFHFTDADGLVRTRSIYRHGDQLLTGRFYLPLSGLNIASLRSVEIEGAQPFGFQARLATCS
ncbi:MAG: alginate biosynthesis protein AlgX [Candidatus Azotimanducaceae bacterium]|jgi:alginate biosynthesis protein AlgX